MNPSDIDLGPLTWVHGEIDLALARAIDSLSQAPVADASTLRFAQTHLHQARGALSIVGLDGLTHFCETVESVLEKAADTPDAPPPQELLVRAIVAVRQFLDELLDGAPNQTLRLQPIYDELQAARGVEQVLPSDLFFPDLSLRPPRPAEAPKPLSPLDLARTLRRERARFEQGLLSWLRNPGEGRGLEKMQKAVANIELSQPVPSARAFWWITGGLIDGLKSKAVASDFYVKRLFARIDLQMRRLMEGSRTVAERVMRDALYYVATARPGDARLEAVRGTYRLESLLPVATSETDLAPLLPLLRASRDAVQSAKDAWNRFSAGAAVALPLFEDYATQLEKHLEKLGETHLAQLSTAVADTARALRRDPLSHSEPLAMELATTLLLIDEALEHYGKANAELPEQTKVMLARLDAVRQGRPTEDLDSPRLGEMSRHAQEKLFLSHVAREIQTNLEDVERKLDGFFRDKTSKLEWNELAGPIKQIEGALTMLGHDNAVQLLRDCGTRIQAFLAPDSTREQAAFEDVAHKLSGLGFFVDALQHGPADLDAILHPKRPRDEEEEVTGATVESGFRQVARDSQALAEAVMDKPEDAALRAELKANLTTLRDDAKLLADAGVEARAKEALAALEDSDLDAAAKIGAALADVPVAPEIAPPSEDTVRLAGASTDVLDAELLEIFIEEAHEVLGTIAAHLPKATMMPHDQDVLTVIRRAFHTLKGSSRMVGLTSFGEVAWGIEQVMNKWLQLEQDATPALLQLISDAHGVFAGWVAQLEAKGSTEYEARAVTAAAARLLDDGETPPDGSGPGGEPLPAAAPGDAPAPAGGIEAASGSAQHAAADADVAATAANATVPAALGQDDELLGLYLDEARTHLAVLRAELARQRADLGLAPSPDTVRAAHTLAGSSSTIGFVDVRDLARALEHALLRIEAGGAPSAEGAALLDEAAQALDHMIAAIAEHRIALAQPQLIERLEALQPVGPRPQAAPSSLEDMELEALLDDIALGDEDVASAAADASGDPEPAVVSPSVEAPQQPSAPDAGVLAPDDSLAAHAAAEVADAECLPEPHIAQAADAAVEEASPAVAGNVPLQVVSSQAEPVREQRAAHDAAAPGRDEAARVPAPHDDLDPQLLPIFLEEAQDLMRDITADLRSWRAQPDAADAPLNLQRLLHTLKGSARMAGAMRLGEHIHGLESRVVEANDTGRPGDELFDALDNDLDHAAAMLDRLARGESAPEPPPSPDGAEGAAAVAVASPAALADAEPEQAQARPTVRVRADLIDRFVNEAGEMSIARTRVEGELRTVRTSLLDLTENVIRLRNQLREIEIQAETQMASRLAQAEAHHADFDPLEMDRFTRFQELTRMMAESVGDVTTVQQNLFRNLDAADSAIHSQARLNRELSQALMSVRLVPFASLTDRLYRVVRQAAKELHKKVALDIRNGQIELDREVLEKVTGPLEHLLRNAVAHGIESREARLAAGKAETGEILFNLTQEGNEVRIELADDGGGLDFERIRARGVERGLIPADATPSERELTSLIFEPGFSTAENLTEVAGRGVGMDVVKNEVASLGGRVEVVTEAGRGSHFSVVLPMTLAVAPAVLVRSGTKTYAIPSSMVKQVREMKPEQAARVRQAGEAAWLEQNFPYRYLPHLLGDTAARPDPLSHTWLLFLRAGTDAVALEVDDLTGNQEVVVKPIGAQLARVPGIAGATVLGDGEVVLILNPVSLAIRFERTLGGEAVPVPTPVRGEPVVMVVDDSMTVRKITSRMLEREGYRVVTAKDGVDALEKLLEVVPDVMLLDIEMPRMDGFDLTRNIRADAKLKNVPIIMITSRMADKHRNYAREIGVDHYLGKPYNEEELLDLVERYARPSAARGNPLFKIA